jgi:DNA helicase-2/ATP-dependent DNA helicase PcrA
MAEGTPSHLERMNPEQHAAVVTTRGPVLVLAGAGSGKTRVLTRRVAHLLHEGVAPENILAVTFTNKAAAEMKERIHELVGEVADRLWVSTFHSTCARILRTDIEVLGWTRRFAIYDDDDQLRLIKQLIAAAGYDPKMVAARDVSSKIDHYKNRMLGPDDVLAERRSHVGDPVIRIWREYSEALQAADAVDFNDLVGMVVELFQRHPDVLQKWRDRFRFVMVDEYQDTNRAQYLLLRLLADESRNLAVVGDDDQSIYGFRGADVSNILNFQADYPEAKVIRLEQNYRSTGHILTVANVLVAQNTGRLEKKLWTQSPAGAKVQLKVAKDPRTEAAKVVDSIQRIRRMGTSYGEVAIIYRTNALARPFELALSQARIPFRVVGGRKFYERREVRDVLAYLRLLVNPADDAAFLRVVNVPPRGIGAKTQADLRADAQNRGQPLLATARLRAGGSSVGDKGLAQFVQLMDAVDALARGAGLDALVRGLLEQSGYRAMLAADAAPPEPEPDAEGRPRRPAPGRGPKKGGDPEAKERLENLDALVVAAREFEPPPGVQGTFERLTAWLDQVALSADTDDLPEGGEVTLMTVHSSKGLEFPVVFVVQMNERIFPHERSGDEGIEEERRLAYVAFTRAMQRLIVTRSLQDAAGAETQPSRFLFGLPNEVLDGDLPDGEPAMGERQARALEVEEARAKLPAFLAHRRTRPLGVPTPPAAPPDPDGTVTEIEVESLDQLRPGVRVRVPMYGVGEIKRVEGRDLLVVFPAFQRRVKATAALRIVVD